MSPKHQEVVARTVHSKSGNVEILIGDYASKVIKLFSSRFTSGFVFNSIDGMHGKCQLV